MDKEKNLAISKEIDQQVLEVMANNLKGFEKAFVVSSALSTLRQNLSGDFMKPIMDLQGSRLGFLTDKDKTGGYPEKAVKDCLIDAVLLGLQPTGNHFNIISGNMYPTREGFGYLLDNIPTLRKSFDFIDVNKVEKSKVSYVTVEITWKINDEDPKKQKIKFPVKSDAYTSHDALIGKAERKAKRWLFNTIKGTDIADADVEDIPHKVVSSEQQRMDPDAERMKMLVSSIETLDDVEIARANIPDTEKVLHAEIDTKEQIIKKEGK